MGITKTTATVYIAPTAKRRYLTRRSAIEAEARALIERKYPTEPDGKDEYGRDIGGGFYWRSMPKADELFKRVCRLVARRSVDAAAGRKGGDR